LEKKNANERDTWIGKMNGENQITIVGTPSANSHRGFNILKVEKPEDLRDDEKNN
jgi:hypothetical protein